MLAIRKAIDTLEFNFNRKIINKIYLYYTRAYTLVFLI